MSRWPTRVAFFNAISSEMERTISVADLNHILFGNAGQDWSHPSGGSHVLPVLQHTHADVADMQDGPVNRKRQFPGRCRNSLDQDTSC